MKSCFAVISLVLFAPVVARAAEISHFSDVIQPLLVAKCVSCHGIEKQEGGLRLDSFDAARTGGERGPALVPGDLEKSLLIQAIRFTDPDLQMPPKQKLSDSEIETFSKWVGSGADWPEPVTVLFEDEPTFLSELKNGNGQTRIVKDDKYAGLASFTVTPLQRESPKIPHWNFPIREKPKSGEFRFLRLAWKKRGSGSVMIELASSGHWPDAKVPQGRYVAGPNSTGWAAISVAETAPVDWTVVVFDLWQDMGEFTLTGMAPTCDQGDEARFDSIILGPTIASLNAYRPGLGKLATPVTGPPAGDAFTDKRNPIRQLFRGERLDLWSLKQPTRSAIPQRNQEVRPTDVVAEMAIDAFIHGRLQRAGLKPTPAADARTLIKRITSDLTGLPPTIEEVDAFLRETEAEEKQATSALGAPQSSSTAYARLVDRLLNSPRYGERQARLWLDVVRYADTNGYERDEFRPLAWQYRDYVIRAFNQDKSFREFIREQLAGDELIEGVPHDAAEADKLIATGFLRLGQWDSTASIFQEEPRLRAEMMADLTNTTASAFLGLTMSCCQCHDHKYDPLSQADHYRFRAFFAGVKPHDDLVVATAEEREDVDRHNAEIREQVAPLELQRTKLLEAARQRVSQERRAQLPPEAQAELGSPQADKKKLQPILDQLKVNDQDALAALDETAKKQHTDLSQQISELNAKQRAYRHAMGATDDGPNAPATHLFFQGDFASPREEVAPGFVSVFTPGPAEIQPPRENTTGRRLALANWITAPENPWTARVFVNRVWQQHFGSGLVATPNDFGYSGSRPTHPELLDWLATEFVRNDWSVKKLHRLIVMSQTYRQSSRVDRSNPAINSLDSAKPDQIDPENTLLWRQNVQRLDAETLRDSLLAVSGLLASYDSGKPRWPQVPEELLHAQPAILEAEKGGDGGRMQGWYTDPIEQTNVRSIFLIRKRCLPIPFLQAFDLPDTTVSCARRNTTVVAPQALMLLNSPEGIRYAQAFADRVKLEAEESSERQIEVAFRHALLRKPDPDEFQLSRDFLTLHLKKHVEAGDGAALLALTDLCRALLNLNEFAYLD